MNKIKLNSKNIINIRKNIDAEIIKNWRIIKNENVMSNKAIKAGLGSGKDIKALYNEILQLQEKRIKIKGILQALNNGVTTFNYSDFKNTNNYNIFAAGEVKETISHLKTIPTINPVQKSKKGLKGLGKKESLSSAKIAQLIKDLQLKANSYDEKLEIFNSSTDIELDEIDSSDFNKALAF